MDNDNLNAGREGKIAAVRETKDLTAGRQKPANQLKKLFIESDGPDSDHIRGLLEVLAIHQELEPALLNDGLRQIQLPCCFS